MLKSSAYLLTQLCFWKPGLPSSTFYHTLQYNLPGRSSPAATWNWGKNIKKP
jgi:hypothetical protein